MEKKARTAYEMVVGLEVHAELKTQTKIFCDCKTDFGAPPNTQCCPACCGFPGTLPVLNEKVVRYAVMAGLATNCEIAERCHMDRKNYFYPDLPKAYQLSQLDEPICARGYLEIETECGGKRIGITRIHIEEDAGKLVHEENGGTLIDYNRSGMPLIEIVSEPDLRSAEEVRAYLQKLRAILLYTGVSDAKMNEGSLRCDVNLSVREKGAQGMGVRAEIKNLNSFGSIARAIEYEYARQVEALEAGEALEQETRRFDQQTGKTHSMRRKEDATDYRYFPEPNLPPIEIGRAMIDEIRSAMPALPDERKRGYVQTHGLSPHVAEQLTYRREIADFFERAADTTGHAAHAANLLLSLIAPKLDDPSGAIDPGRLGTIAQLLGEGTINAMAARSLVEMLIEGDIDPEAVVRERNWARIGSKEELTPYVRAAIDENEDAAARYRAGKDNALNVLLKSAIDKTDRRGDPAVIRELLVEMLGR